MFFLLAFLLLSSSLSGNHIDLVFDNHLVPHLEQTTIFSQPIPLPGAYPVLPDQEVVITPYGND